MCIQLYNLYAIHDDAIGMYHVQTPSNTVLLLYLFLYDSRFSNLEHRLLEETHHVNTFSGALRHPGHSALLVRRRALRAAVHLHVLRGAAWEQRWSSSPSFFWKKMGWRSKNPQTYGFPNKCELNLKPHFFFESRNKKIDKLGLNFGMSTAQLGWRWESTAGYFIGLDNLETKSSSGWFYWGDGTQLDEHFGHVNT